MGQGESRESFSTPGSGLAFHVLRVADNSPAAEAGLDPFFDFLCGVNGQPLGNDVEGLTKVLEASENVSLTLQVWSTKRQEMRSVRVIPSRRWSSGSTSISRVSSQQTSHSHHSHASSHSHNSSLTSEPELPSLLGLSLRLCHPQHALENVWHVLEILEGSPAQDAGLVPFGDWILGYSGGVLRSESDFYEVVEKHIGEQLRLYVYNIDFDVTREVVIIPNREWSPNQSSLLGCGVGYGLLHRIPKPSDRPPSELQDTPPQQYQTQQQGLRRHEEEEPDYTVGVEVVSQDETGGDFFTPFDMAGSSANTFTPSPPKGAGRKGHVPPPISTGGNERQKGLPDVIAEDEEEE